MKVELYCAKCGCLIFGRIVEHKSTPYCCVIEVEPCESCKEQNKMGNVREQTKEEKEKI